MNAAWRRGRDPRGSRSKVGTGGGAEAQRPARARRTLLRGSLAKHRFLRAIVCFQDVARRKISASIFFVMSIPPRPAAGPPPFVGREEDAEGRRRFQFCIERFQDIGRLFCNFPKPESRHSRRLGCPGRARSPRPYQMLWVRGFRGHTISGRRFNLFNLFQRHFQAGNSARRLSAGFHSLPAFPKVADFSAAPTPCLFHRWFWLYCIQRLHQESQPNARVCKSLGILAGSRSEPSATGSSGIVEATSRDASTNCVF